VVDTAFAPVLDGEVESLAVAPDGLHVFAGGSFTKINGVAQKSLVKLRLSDGARITAFKGRTNARVKEMAVSGGRLYIAGTFKTVNGVSRTALAAVDPVTGALSGDVNLAFTGPRAGSLCDTAARWETGATGPGQQPTWVDYTGGDTLYSVAVAAAAVYVGGHQRWMNNSFAGDKAGPGAVAREGIAPSTRSTACRCPGTRDAAAAWACSPSWPPPRACGSAATPSASAATSTTPASPSCPWPAAPRCPSPRPAPCPATCSASAWTAP
jgi:hypothetical protein